MRWSPGVAVVLFLLASRAGAQTEDEDVKVTYSEDEETTAERLPVRYVSRPLTLPHFVLRPFATLSVLHLSLGDFGFSSSETAVGLELGASIGLFDDLELGIAPVPLLLAPDFDYGDIPVVGRYRFLDLEAVELGVELLVLIPTNTDFGLTPGVPIRFHALDVASVDTGVFFPMRFGDSDSTGVTVSLGIPLRANIQIIDMLFVGLETGFSMGLALGEAGDFIDHADTISIPLGLSLGFTLPADEGPMFDLIAGFRFPTLFIPALEDPVVTEIYLFTLSFQFHLFL